MNLVFFTFYYPPLMAPRSIQISRMVKYSRHPIRVICAQADKLSDSTLEGAWDENPRHIERALWAKHGWYLPWNALLHPPVPDHYRHWAMTTARQAIKQDYFRKNDLLVTFGQPMSDHLAGLKIKRAIGLPWVAHFSDPWFDSPYRGRWPLVSRLNQYEEREVVAAADRVIFTSEETLELVMDKYPRAWRARTRILPHAFDSSLYREASGERARFLIRHLGALRKPRTPDALLKGLQHLALTRPDFLSRIQVELIGRVESDMNLERLGLDLPVGTFKVTRPVDYMTSLRMMSESDLLLVLDAPFDTSVFLPSKLIDYIGAGRPILAVTPQGTSAELVSQLGGWTVAPGDPAAIAEKLVEAVEACSDLDRVACWGTPSVRNRYEMTRVVPAFDDMIEELARTIT